MKIQVAFFILAFSIVSACQTPLEKTSERKPGPLVKKAFIEEECPEMDRGLTDSHYQGPLIDTHIHIAHLPDGPVPPFLDKENEQPLMGVSVTMNDYMCMMEVEATEKVFGFFSVWDPIVDESIRLVEETMQRFPGKFVPFIMPPDHDNDPDGYPTVTAETLEEMLGLSPELFVGYGEIGLYAREGGAKELLPDSERLTEIYPVVRERQLLVYFHLGEAHQDEFEKTLDANPDINFIWHGDQLIRYEDGVQNLEAVEEILSRHPNAYYGVDELYGDVWLLKPGVTKEEFLAHFENPEALLEQDAATWKAFIERHPDQVLWGTDRGWSTPWSLDPEVAVTLNNYSRAFINLLDPSVQAKFAHKNAESLLK